MGITVTFNGMSAKKVADVKDAMYDLVGKETPDEVTATDIKKCLVHFVNKRVRQNQRAKAISQTEQDFNDSYEDPI